MAARKKPKSKPKAKKARMTKAAARKKTAPTRKTKAARKKPAKKLPIRRASPKKRARTAKVQTKQTVPSVQPVAAPPTPSPPSQPAAPGERIGVVTHYYSHLSVATMRLDTGTLRVGDVIHVRGHTTDFSQKVASLEVNHASVTEVGPNDDFGLKVVEHAREHDIVYKVHP